MAELTPKLLVMALSAGLLIGTAVGLIMGRPKTVGQRYSHLGAIIVLSYAAGFALVSTSQ